MVQNSNIQMLEQQILQMQAQLQAQLQAQAQQQHTQQAAPMRTMTPPPAIAMQMPTNMLPQMLPDQTASKSI